jgi:hypothetical protein
MKDLYKAYADMIASNKNKEIIKEAANNTEEAEDNLRVETWSPIEIPQDDGTMKSTMKFDSFKEFIDAVKYYAFDIGYGDIDDLYWEVGAGADLRADVRNYTNPDAPYSYETLLAYFNSSIDDSSYDCDNATVRETPSDTSDSKGIRFTVYKK